jgi:hypothetical protein
MHSCYLAIACAFLVAALVVATVGGGASFWVSAKAKTLSAYQTAFENACIFLMAGGSAAGLILLCCLIAAWCCRSKWWVTSVTTETKEHVVVKRRGGS